MLGFQIPVGGDCAGRFGGWYVGGTRTIGRENLATKGSIESTKMSVAQTTNQRDQRLKARRLADMFETLGSHRCGAIHLYQRHSCKSR